jgi:hypothetical protein
VASYDYANITGVEVHIGALTGAVAILAPGDISVSTSYWKDGKSDPSKARNAIPVGRPMAPVNEAVARLRELIAAYHQRPPAVVSSAPQPDLIDRLERLGRLRDSGVLTAEEFAAQKAELLN